MKYFLNFLAFDIFSILFDTFFFVLGSIIGSFLNVVIHRLPREESIVFPNSACPSCQAPIHFYDNVPILSWLLLRGKCRNCRQTISARYPIVEAITGVLFLAVFRHDGFNPLLPFDLAFVCAIIALMFIDAEHMILPNLINYPGLLLALIARIALPLITGMTLFDDLQHAPLANLDSQPIWLISIFGAAFGALVGGGSLWLLGWLWKRLRNVEAMGLGDVKMMLMVGAFLGWRLTLLTLFLAALTGALTGIIFALVKGQRTLQTQIPFGIFLGLGSILSLFAGDNLINWYISTFIPK